MYITDADGLNLLHYLSIYNHYSLLQNLLHDEAFINQRDQLLQLAKWSRCRMGKTPLLYAVQVGALGVVKVNIIKGICIFISQYLYEKLWYY